MWNGRCYNAAYKNDPSVTGAGPAWTPPDTPAALPAPTPAVPPAGPPAPPPGN